MSSEDWKQVERSPLGKVRDLNKEEAEKLLAFEFVPLERHRELADALSGIGKEINSLRKNYGIPELQFQCSDIRLISEERWEQFVEYVHVQEDNGAFWDPLTEKCYIKYSPEKYDSSRLEKVTMMYVIAHEMGHRTLPNLAPYPPWRAYSHPRGILLGGCGNLRFLLHGDRIRYYV